MRCSLSEAQRETDSIKWLYQKGRKMSHQHLSFHLQKLKKEKKYKPKASRKKEIIKIRAKFNEIENKKTGEKDQGNKSWFFEKMNKIINVQVDCLRKKKDTCHQYQE